MNSIHIPKVDRRYWAAITLASVFGTNLGDLYAHNSGLGVGVGLLILAVIAMAGVLLERVDTRAHQVYYWLVIIIIRTGATNIADGLAHLVRIPGSELPRLILALFFAVMISLFGWRSVRGARQQSNGLPNTDTNYWFAMLGAGVFGTLLGDVFAHLLGQGAASLVLAVMLALALLLRHRGLLGQTTAYWVTVSVARTAGTAMGDWFAENKVLNIGLPLSTLLTGAAFVTVLLLWRSRPAKRVGLGPAI
ncbi:MAG: hypothetical protein JO369_07350 [Paucibacter sp.]|nr:hypothetical protein [Roseateles sp.]